MAPLAAAPSQPVADDRGAGQRRDDHRLEDHRLDGHRLDDERTRAAFRTVRMLVGGYLTLSVLTMAAVVLLRDHPALVTDAVWTRTSIVTVSAVVTVALATAAARGSRGAFRRLRIVSTVMVIAIAVIVAIPGDFPTWLKTEQGACGLLLLGVVRRVRGRQLRGVFAAVAE